MASGEINNASYFLKTFVEDNMDDIAHYIDWSWFFGEQENLTIIDYNHWMGYDGAEKTAGPAVDWNVYLGLRRGALALVGSS